VRLTADLHYAAAPSDVRAMLTDPAFQERKCRDGHALSQHVEVTTESGVTRVVVSRAQATDDFPPFVKSFVGATLTVVETSLWQPQAADGSCEGTITVEITGAPIVLRARARLFGAEGTPVPSTIETVEGELKAAVPFLGAKIEQAAEPAIRAAIVQEERSGAAWLSRR
jgi:hypothetical protein